MKYGKVLITSCLALCMLYGGYIPLSAATPMQAKAKPDYEVIAGFLKAFAVFSRWPKDASPNDGENFTIGTFEKNDVITFFSKSTEGKTIKGKKIKVVFLEDYEEIKQCHLLYIPKTSSKKLGEILETAKGEPILTIADEKGYEKKGVMICIFKVERNLKFNVNLKAAQDSGLLLSSKLLKLANELF